MLVGAMALGLAPICVLAGLAIMVFVLFGLDDPFDFPPRAVLVFKGGAWLLAAGLVLALVATLIGYATILAAVA